MSSVYSSRRSGSPAPRTADIFAQAIQRTFAADQTLCMLALSPREFELNIDGGVHPVSEWRPADTPFQSDYRARSSRQPVGRLRGA